MDVKANIGLKKKPNSSLVDNMTPKDPEIVDPARAVLSWGSIVNA